MGNKFYFIYRFTQTIPLLLCRHLLGEFGDIRLRRRAWLPALGFGKPTAARRAAEPSRPGRQPTTANQGLVARQRPCRPAIITRPPPVGQQPVRQPASQWLLAAASSWLLAAARWRRAADLWLLYAGCGPLPLCHLWLAAGRPDSQQQGHPGHKPTKRGGLSLCQTFYSHFASFSSLPPRDRACTPRQTPPGSADSRGLRPLPPTPKKKKRDPDAFRARDVRRG